MSYEPMMPLMLAVTLRVRASARQALRQPAGAEFETSPGRVRHGWTAITHRTAGDPS